MDLLPLPRDNENMEAKEPFRGFHQTDKQRSHIFHRPGIADCDVRGLLAQNSAHLNSTRVPNRQQSMHGYCCTVFLYMWLPRCEFPGDSRVCSSRGSRPDSSGKDSTRRHESRDSLLAQTHPNHTPPLLCSGSDPRCPWTSCSDVRLVHREPP